MMMVWACTGTARKDKLKVDEIHIFIINDIVNHNDRITQ